MTTFLTRDTFTAGLIAQGTTTVPTPVNGTDAANKDYVDSKAGAPPTGIIAPFGGTAAPAGWLLCNAAAVSRTTYSALFAVIGTAYGVGDGSTTFNVPGMKDMIGVGASFITRTHIIKT